MARDIELVFYAEVLLPSLFISINSLLVDEIVYDLLEDFRYSNTDRKVLYCTVCMGFTF